MIDTHCHLFDGSFDNDRQQIIDRAFLEGVTKIIEISIESNLWQSSLDLCKQYENIFCSIGIHPNDAGKYTDFLHFLNDKKVIAIGECGLDYYRNEVDRKVQIDIFEKQLEIAAKYKKSVIVHCRQAEEDAFSVLSNAKNINGVIHCFSSSVEFAERILKLGFYIGIDGPVTYPNAHNLREVVKKIPLERILLETDSPYLPPQNFRGTRNEPAYIKHIAEKIAEIKNIEVSEISKITDENAKKLFGI